MSKIIYCFLFVVIFQTKNRSRKSLKPLWQFFFSIQDVIQLLSNSPMKSSRVFFHQRPCTPSLLGAFQVQQLSTLTGDHVRYYPQCHSSCYSSIPNSNFMRFSSTPDVTPKLPTFVCIWDNILKFIAVLFNSW